MTTLARARLVTLAGLLAAAVGAAGAQSVRADSSPRAKVPLTGTWTGKLVLDNAQPDLEIEFSEPNGAIAAKLRADGGAFGDAERLVIRGDSIFFNVDRLEFSGRISGPRITFSILMYNGVTRRPLVVTRRPDPPGGSALDVGATSRR